MKKYLQLLTLMIVAVVVVSCMPGNESLRTHAVACLKNEYPLMYSATRLYVSLSRPLEKMSIIDNYSYQVDFKYKLSNGFNGSGNAVIQFDKRHRKYELLSTSMGHVFGDSELDYGFIESKPELISGEDVLCFTIVVKRGYSIQDLNDIIQTLAFARGGDYGVYKHMFFNFFTNHKYDGPKYAVSDVNVINNDYHFATQIVKPSEPGFEYKVLNRQESSARYSTGIMEYKVTYTIEIPVEYTEDKLNEIADYIESEEKESNVFIEYYLPNQPKSGVNYGLSKRTSKERSTIIQYVPLNPEVVKDKPAPYEGGKVYGKWDMGGGAMTIAYTKNGKTYMVNYYSTSSEYSAPEVFLKTTFHGHTAFKNSEDPDDMYVIESDGSLGGYYMGDRASTFPKVN